MSNHHDGDSVMETVTKRLSLSSLDESPIDMETVTERLSVSSLHESAKASSSPFADTDSPSHNKKRKRANAISKPSRKRVKGKAGVEKEVVEDSDVEPEEDTKRTRANVISCKLPSRPRPKPKAVEKELSEDPDFEIHDPTDSDYEADTHKAKHAARSKRSARKPHGPQQKTPKYPIGSAPDNEPLLERRAKSYIPPKKRPWDARDQSLYDQGVKRDIMRWKKDKIIKAEGSVAFHQREGWYLSDEYSENDRPMPSDTSDSETE